jgi:hypothetical protein
LRLQPRHRRLAPSDPPSTFPTTHSQPQHIMYKCVCSLLVVLSFSHSYAKPLSPPPPLALWLSSSSAQQPTCKNTPICIHAHTSHTLSDTYLPRCQGMRRNGIGVPFSVLVVTGVAVRIRAPVRVRPDIMPARAGTRGAACVSRAASATRWPRCPRHGSTMP